MKRSRNLPFGASVTVEGHVRFRLWAPDKDGVDLLIIKENGESLYPMKRQADGWFSLSMTDIGVGGRYFYVSGGARFPDPASRCQPDGPGGPSRVVDPNSTNWNDETWAGRPWEEMVIFKPSPSLASAQDFFRRIREDLEGIESLGATAVLLPHSQSPFAPDHLLGSPEDMKMLIEEAHSRNLMVFMDIAWSGFSQEAENAHLSFIETKTTPWGDPVDFKGERGETARDFLTESALFWLEEYNLDGLCLLDAAYVFYKQERNILMRLARAIKEGPGTIHDRYLILGQGANVRYVEKDAEGNPPLYKAVIVGDSAVQAKSGEKEIERFCASLAGESTPYPASRIFCDHMEDGKEAHSLFTSSQEAAGCLNMILALAPLIPMITGGKKPEDFPVWLREALEIRKKEIAPRLAGIKDGRGKYTLTEENAVSMSWTLADGSELALLANLSDENAYIPELPEGDLLFESESGAYAELTRGITVPWSVVWLLDTSSVGA